MSPHRIELDNKPDLPLISTVATPTMSSASLTPTEVAKEQISRVEGTTSVCHSRITPISVVLSGISTPKPSCSSWSNRHSQIVHKKQQFLWPFTVILRKRGKTALEKRIETIKKTKLAEENKQK